jgi:hypothetical protein
MNVIRNQVCIKLLIFDVKRDGVYTSSWDIKGLMFLAAVRMIIVNHPGDM